ncbi:hypothetical protein GCWU000246_00285 [Jonquetella anthropi E3_33 E1]|nr:hypothetical protein GCWU000246_00285 [Jonquetella anthropi E3_33 E1]
MNNIENYQRRLGRSGPVHRPSRDILNVSASPRRRRIRRGRACLR